MFGQVLGRAGQCWLVTTPMPRSHRPARRAHTGVTGLGQTPGPGVLVAPSGVSRRRSCKACGLVASPATFVQIPWAEFYIWSLVKRLILETA